MASSLTEIFVLACVEMKIDGVGNADEARPTAATLRAVWPTARDATLRAHPWNFAIDFWRLASGAAPSPANGYGYAYALPNQPYCLRPLELVEDDSDWEDVGRRLMTDAENPVLRGIARITDVSQYDPQFDHAVALRLAYMCAPKLVRSGADLDRVERRFADMLTEGRATDSQTGKRRKPARSNLLDARR